MTKKLEERVTVLETTVALQYPTIMQGINSIRDEIQGIHEAIVDNTMGIQRNQNRIAGVDRALGEHREYTVRTLREVRRDNMQALVKWAAAVTAVCTTVVSLVAYVISGHG